MIKQHIIGNKKEATTMLTASTASTVNLQRLLTLTLVSRSIDCTSINMNSISPSKRGGISLKMCVNAPH